MIEVTFSIQQSVRYSEEQRADNRNFGELHLERLQLEIIINEETKRKRNTRREIWKLYTQAAFYPGEPAPAPCRPNSMIIPADTRHVQLASIHFNIKDFPDLVS